MRRVLKLVLLLIVGFNLKTVYAGGIGIAINSVTQNGVPLEYVNNKYVVTDYNEIAIDYELINYDESKEYTIVFEGKGGNGSQSYDKKFHYYYVSVNNDEPKYTIKICDTYECNTIYSIQEIEFDYQMYEVINNSRLYVERVVQYGNEIVGEKYNKGWDANYSRWHSENTIEYQVNKIQIVEVDLRAENLIDDMNYQINDSIIYTGSELENGVTLTIYPNENYFYLPTSMSISLSRENQYIDILKAISEDDYEFSLRIVNDDNVKDFVYGFEYANYSNVSIGIVDDYDEIYGLNGNYFNKDNPLKIKFQKDVIDLDAYYPLKITISRKGMVYFTTEMDVRGDIVKNGDFISTNALQLDYITTLEDDYEDYYYNLAIELDGVGHNVLLLYNSLGVRPRIYERIYYEDGKQSLMTAKGRGGVNWGAGVYPSHNTIFQKYPKIYLRFRSDDDFDNNMLYDYILEYGEYKNVNNNDEAYIVNKTLKTGKIKGSVLNGIGAYFQVDNANDYEMPMYRFTVKNGDEILYASTPVVEQTDLFNLASASLKANNKNLFLKKKTYMLDEYIATRNAPIDMYVSGLGFDEDKDYTFDVHYTFYDVVDNYSSENELYTMSKTVTFSGKDLNKGKAVVHSNIKIEKEYASCFIYIVGYSAQGGVYIEFVDSKDLLTNTDKYVLDNSEDIIKKIKKNTSVIDFINNFTVKNNGKLKIFDSTGVLEISDKIGTGMLARVINELDENIFDLDVVVTGDVNGDGNISVTDLARLERYIAKLTELDGVYEKAADVNDNGTVTLTDLTKIVRDIAKLEEIE